MPTIGARNILYSVAAASVMPPALSLTLPCSIHGLSVSEKGFVALLADPPRSRLLPLLVADDRARASSTEALTLLQLLQGIDLGGPGFPPEQLQTYGCDAAGSLQHVLVSAPDSFSLCLWGDANVPLETSFEAVAFSMRYNVPLVIEAPLLDQEAFDASECDFRYPACFTTMDAAQQRLAITKRMAGRPDDASPPQAPSPTGKSALDVTAFDVAALRTAVDECAPTPPPVEEGLNANAPPPDMVERVLAMAKKKGDAAAIERIEKQILIEQLKRDLKARS